MPCSFHKVLPCFLQRSLCIRPFLYISTFRYFMPIICAASPPFYAGVCTMVSICRPMITESPFLRMGSYSASMEEYGEAMAFLVFLKEGRLVRKSELPLCDTEEYLGAILDFTGELNRFCVKAATARDKEAVKRCRDLCDAIMGEFLQFNLRNSSPRKKFDSLKYTLKKLENTLYELSLTENLGLKTLGKEEEPDAETGQGPNADVE
uniref:Translin n=1 Tax=Dunaliella tertiolecta TaxID=3047 RepID=A0A7S3R598_DUNTE